MLAKRLVNYKPPEMRPLRQFDVDSQWSHCFVRCRGKTRILVSYLEPHDQHESSTQSRDPQHSFHS